MFEKLKQLIPRKGKKQQSGYVPMPKNAPMPEPLSPNYDQAEWERKRPGLARFHDSPPGRSTPPKREDH